MSEGAETGKGAGGEMESGLELGNGIEPGIWINAEALENWEKIGIDRAAFAGMQDASGGIDQDEILRIGHLQDATVVSIELDGTEPGMGGMGGGGFWVADLELHDLTGTEVLCGHLAMPGANALLNAGEVGQFGSRSEAGTDGIEVDVNHTGGDGSEIEEGAAFEAGLPETAFEVIFDIGLASDEFVQTAHEPADTGQTLTELSDAVGIGGEGGDLLIGGGIL